MTRPSRRLSLAARLVLLFAIGSAVIMAAAGYALYHALRMQLEAQDHAEVTGKTEVVEHVLHDIDSPEALASNLNRLREISIGHPHLSISALSGGAGCFPRATIFFPVPFAPPSLRLHPMSRREQPIASGGFTAYAIHGRDTIPALSMSSWPSKQRKRTSSCVSMPR